jgi:hypothetical protein
MTIAIGAIAAAAGLYFVLVSLGVLPPPGRKNPQTPLWIAFCAGLGFLLAGIAVVSRALTEPHARMLSVADDSRSDSRLFHRSAGKILPKSTF